MKLPLFLQPAALHYILKIFAITTSVNQHTVSSSAEVVNQKRQAHYILLNVTDGYSILCLSFLQKGSPQMQDPGNLLKYHIKNYIRYRT